VSREEGGVGFQLERFELVGDGRLEISGQWLGTRGLRFMRPSLSVTTPEGERKLLALLEHKPWAAEEGKTWIAAFNWDGDPIDPAQAELAVAPSVVVPLSGAAGAATGNGKSVRKQTLHERLEAEEQRARRLEREVEWLRTERHELLAAKAENLRLSSELSAALAERDDAVRERDAAVSEREAALPDRERAINERDAAIRERDALLTERDDAVNARDQAQRDLDSVGRERDAALRERDQAVTERDDALASSRSALAQRDAALGRGSGIPAVSAAEFSLPAEAERRRRDWIAPALAITCLIVLVLVIFALLRAL
jgi:hypothetical protein